jgi:hypothetical protein
MQIINPKILLFIYLIIGVISSFFANRNGRNPYLWFTLGVLFGIWSFIILFFLGYQERRKASKTFPTLTSSSKISIIKDSKFWYYLNNDKKEIGPMSSSMLQNLYQSGKVTNSTYIWNEDFKDWKYLKDTEMYTGRN